MTSESEDSCDICKRPVEEKEGRHLSFLTEMYYREFILCKDPVCLDDAVIQLKDGASRAAGPFSLTEELDLEDMPAQVCITHRRFVPCRSREGCALSAAPWDIEAVRQYQTGKEEE